MTTQDPGMRVLSERLSSVQRAREGFLIPMPEDGRLPPFGNGEFCWQENWDVLLYLRKGETLRAVDDRR